jgi:hypothetical protein
MDWLILLSVSKVVTPQLRRFALQARWRGRVACRLGILLHYEVCPVANKYRPQCARVRYFFLLQEPENFALRVDGAQFIQPLTYPMA